VSLAAEAAGSLFAAGVVAGIIGSGGGVTSLVSYRPSSRRDPPLRPTSPIWVAGVANRPRRGPHSRRELVETRTVLVDSRIAPANAIKNVLLRVTSLVAAAVFIATGPVLWAAVLPQPEDSCIGSALGPIIVRHLPPKLVRWTAATFGFILAICLWVRPP
jgi:uncharacterized membrane protein YfcA